MTSSLLRWLPLLALLLAPAASAQTSAVSGTVTDASSGNPIPGVNIRVEATQIGTTTDADGRYELSLPVDNRTLVFTFIGYRSQEVEVPSGEPSVDVQL